MKLALKTKISTPRLADTKAWYQRLFAMKVVEEWDHDDDKGVIMAFENGHEEVLLEIYYTDTEYDFSGLSLQFRAEPLDDFVASLPDDVDRDGPKARPWGARYLYMRDPNDIMIIVYEGCY